MLRQYGVTNVFPHGLVEPVAGAVEAFLGDDRRADQALAEARRRADDVEQDDVGEVAAQLERTDVGARRHGAIGAFARPIGGDVDKEAERLGRSEVRRRQRRAEADAIGSQHGADLDGRYCRHGFRRPPCSRC
jgi:hypothetical protein